MNPNQTVESKGPLSMTMIEELTLGLTKSQWDIHMKGKLVRGTVLKTRRTSYSRFNQKRILKVARIFTRKFIRIFPHSSPFLKDLKYISGRKLLLDDGELVRSTLLIHNLDNRDDYEKEIEITPIPIEDAHTGNISKIKCIKIYNSLEEEIGVSYNGKDLIKNDNY